LRSSKRLLRKIEDSIGGIGLSDILDPKNFDLSWGEEALLEIASSLILNSEKKKKLVKATKSSRNSTKRRQFTKLCKQRVLIQQDFRCKSCKNSLEFPEFDHIDGNNSNNEISNCQALCPNCHAKKTRKKQRN